LTTYESSGGSPWSTPIIGGAEGRWYVGASAGNFASYDDARTWQGPLLAGPQDDPDGWIPDFSSTDGQGLWLALYALGYVDHLDWTRSEDDAATWAPRATLAEWPHLTRDCDDCQILARDVAWGPGGTVIVTWSFRDGYEEYVEGPDGGVYEWHELEVNYAIRSSDGGSSWGELQTLSTGTSPRSGIDVETDGQGTWIVVWSDTDLFMTRSEDDGLSWSEPVVIAVNAAPRYWSNTEVRHVTDDRWVIVFSSSTFGEDIYGIDEDVFSLRSMDGGVTWGAPIPVNLDAREDGATDTSSALSVDDAGRAIVAWESFRPLGNEGHIDADVFAAVSTDGGATWSAPATVNPGADTDTDYDGAPRLLADERGTWLALWQRRADGQRRGGREVDKTVVAISGHECGNGVVEVGEACDDGNTSDDDGCDSDCSITACGNGVVAGGEECDDSNGNDEDGCLSSCVAATCGDGIIWRRVEECDWGDEIDPAGWCVPGCRYARCGDGFVYEGVEQCDDGNYRGDDACTQQCKPARCGDGYVFTGVEPCDDGNGANDDACVGRCELASCGDGYVRTDVEECDPAVGIQQPYCVAGCRLAHACGDGDGDDAVRVGDALYMLRAAIGLEPVCPAFACDVDRNGTVTILDADRPVRRRRARTGFARRQRRYAGSGELRRRVLARRPAKRRRDGDRRSLLAEPRKLHGRSGRYGVHSDHTRRVRPF
jgi:cysteine-rich repeat protein